MQSGIYVSKKLKKVYFLVYGACVILATHMTVHASKLRDVITHERDFLASRSQVIPWLLGLAH